MGVFAAPAVIEAEILRHYRVRVVGRAEAVRQQFYAISVERKIKHPAVVAICEARAPGHLCGEASARAAEGQGRTAAEDRRRNTSARLSRASPPTGDMNSQPFVSRLMQSSTSGSRGVLPTTSIAAT